MSEEKSGLLEYVIVHYRWVLCIFLLPLSVVYDAFFNLRSWVVFKLRTAPRRHDIKVKEVQRQVRAWQEDGMRTTMCTARPGWQTMSLRVGKYKQTSYRIRLDLVDILEVDTDRETVRVEPLVTIGQLTSILCPLGWTLPVVPELNDLTVGGMINGVGLESSSHIYGVFQDICIAYELVLSDGSLIRCTKDENSDLFYSIPWSHGTLGFVVSAELRIVPCKPFVRLEYLPLRTTSALCDALTTAARCQDEAKSDFVEVLMYTKDSGVLMLGTMTDDVELDKINPIGKFYKPWFYKHVENFLSSGENRVVEYIPLRDYYHRHTKSLFWEMDLIVPFGNWTPFRYLLGWTMPPKVSFLKLTQGETIRRLYEFHHFLQDPLIPINKLEMFLKYMDGSVKVYPIWICPFRMFQQPGMVHCTTEEDIYVDVGYYGVPQVKSFKAAETTHNMEEFLSKIKGYKMLYADTYMNETKFRKMFDHTLYDQVRKQFSNKKAFPDVYHKICKQARH